MLETKGSIPGSGRSPEEGNGNPLQDNCLGKPWTEELGGLWSVVSQAVRCDLATKQQITFRTQLKTA